MQQTIQWFPGHMTKTRRQMEKVLPLVDAVVELRDARIPYASANPELGKLIGNKPRLVILNKADMADPVVTEQWLHTLRQSGLAAVAMDSKSGRNVQSFVPALLELLKEKREALARKGMVGRPVYAMVVGIPNVGKSSFINRVAKGSRAKVEDRPGVTRGNQWFTVDKQLQLLDTPGVLWPKFSDQTVAAHLAYTGAIKDDILDCEEIACGLLQVLVQRYPQQLSARYKLTDALPQDSYELLGLLAQKRGMKISGGEPDTERAAKMLLDEFRGTVIGRMSLESPQDCKMERGKEDD